MNSNQEDRKKESNGNAERRFSDVYYRYICNVTILHIDYNCEVSKFS